MSDSDKILTQYTTYDCYHPATGLAGAMQHPDPNPHLIWFTPFFWIVVGYGAYQAYASGFRGVALSLRSGRVKTLGKIYRAQNKPHAFWFVILWNALIAIASTLAAVGMIWAAWAARLHLAMLALLLCVSVGSLAEIQYRIAFRALLKGVMRGKYCFYRRDRHPYHFWFRIVASTCMCVFSCLLFASALVMFWREGDFTNRSAADAHSHFAAPN
jgi:hypothetical protein